MQAGRRLGEGRGVDREGWTRGVVEIGCDERRERIWSCTEAGASAGDVESKERGRSETGHDQSGQGGVGGRV